MFRPRSLSGEVLILASLTLAAALLVNGLRGQSGLDLDRDYFPADSIATESSDGPGDAAENGEATGKPQHGYTSFYLADAKDYQQYLDDQDGVIFLTLAARSSSRLATSPARDSAITIVRISTFRPCSRNSAPQTSS